MNLIFEIMTLAVTIICCNTADHVRRTDLDGCNRRKNVECFCTVPSLRLKHCDPNCSWQDNSEADAKCKAKGFARGFCQFGDATDPQSHIPTTGPNSHCKSFWCVTNKHQIITHFNGSKTFENDIVCQCGDDHKIFVNLDSQVVEILNEQASAIYALQEKNRNQCSENSGK